MRKIILILLLNIVFVCMLFGYTYTMQSDECITIIYDTINIDKVISVDTETDAHWLINIYGKDSISIYCNKTKKTSRYNILDIDTIDNNCCFYYCTNNDCIEMTFVKKKFYDYL